MFKYLIMIVFLWTKWLVYNARDTLKMLKKLPIFFVRDIIVGIIFHIISLRENRVDDFKDVGCKAIEIR